MKTRLETDKAGQIVIINPPKLFVDVLTVLIKKSQDYNAERQKDNNFNIDDPRKEYFPFGKKSYAHMLWTKVLRIVNLLKKKSAPNFEGVKDSIIDLVAYSMFMYSFMAEEDSENDDASN